MKDHMLWRDIKYAARLLRLHPGFTLVAVLSLALGIGANTAIFSLIDRVVLQPLPVRQPNQLVMLDDPGTNPGSKHGRHSFSYPMYRDIRDHNSVFQDVLARYGLRASASYGHDTERVQGELVSGNYFNLLGVRPELGRTFGPEDDRAPGSAPVVVLSYSYFSRRFGKDTSIIGQTLQVNGQLLTIVGVTPPGFFGMEVGKASEFFIPIMMKAKMTPGWDGMENRRDMWVNIFARLKAGVSRQEAENGANVLFHQIVQEEIHDPQIPANWAFKDSFLSKHLFLLDGGRGLSLLRENFYTPLLVLMVFVALVLLSACANIANLLMARGVARQKEIATRLALGAARTQIIRQLLAESMLLALVGGALGIFLAWWLSSALIAMLPAQPYSLTFTAHIDSLLLLFTLGISVITGLVFGLIPALQVSRPAATMSLKPEATSVIGSLTHARFRKALVVAQITLSLLLVCGAGLFAHSLYNLRALNPGFQTDHLLEFGVDPSLNGYKDERELSFLEQLRSRLTTLPGVTSVSATEVAPLSGLSAGQTIMVEGYVPKPEENMNPAINYVGASYFQTLKVPLLMGREFTATDIKGAPKVGLINETAWHYWFHDDSPLGRHFGFCCKGQPDIEIVGVVKDAKSKTLWEEIPRYVYVPYMQDTDLSEITFIIRTSQDPMGITGEVRSSVQQLDSNMPIFNVRSMDNQLDQLLYRERMMSMLAIFFAVLAAVLAAVGLYGVVAYTVSRRTAEIGIRMALGAPRSTVLWLVLKDVVWMSVVAIVIAVPVVLLTGHLLASQLYGLRASDPLTMVGAVMVMGAVAFFAGLVPSLRASRISPIRALRYE